MKIDDNLMQNLSDHQTTPDETDFHRLSILHISYWASYNTGIGIIHRYILPENPKTVGRLEVKFQKFKKKFFFFVIGVYII